MPYRPFAPTNTRFFIEGEWSLKSGRATGSIGDDISTMEDAIEFCGEFVACDRNNHTNFRVIRVDYCVTTGAIETARDVTEEVMAGVADYLEEPDLKMNGVYVPYEEAA